MGNFPSDRALVIYQEVVFGYSRSFRSCISMVCFFVLQLDLNQEFSIITSHVLCNLSKPFTFIDFRMKEHVEDSSKKPILIFPEGQLISLHL